MTYDVTRNGFWLMFLLTRFYNKSVKNKQKGFYICALGIRFYRILCPSVRAEQPPAVFLLRSKLSSFRDQSDARRYRALMQAIAARAFCSVPWSRE